MKHTLVDSVIYSCMDAALAAVGFVEDEVSYEVGEDFCLDEDSPPVELTCGGTGTTVKWLHDGTVVFDGEKMNMDFFMNGTNILLAPGVVNPPPFILKDDYSITFNLQAPSLSSPLADHPEITSDNIQINLFEGSWTCTHNTVSETSKSSPCGELGLSHNFFYSACQVKVLYDLRVLSTLVARKLEIHNQTISKSIYLHNTMIGRRYDHGKGVVSL